MRVTDVRFDMIQPTLPKLNTNPLGLNSLQYAEPSAVAQLNF
jgi:hypothetical protein